jgi:hypothetical protein
MTIDSNLALQLPVDLSSLSRLFIQIMKSSLLILTILLAVTAALPIDKCEWGGLSYWCKSQETAKKCHKVSYCSEYEWKEHNSMDDLKNAILVHGAPVNNQYNDLHPTARQKRNLKSLECDMCKALVGEVKKILENQKTEEEVKNDLIQYCKNFGSYEDTCKSLINDYFDYIWNLVEQLSPQDACTKIGQCMIFKDDIEMRGNDIITSAAFDCSLCDGVKHIPVMHGHHHGGHAQDYLAKRLQVTKKKLRELCNECQVRKANEDKMINMN